MDNILVKTQLLQLLLTVSMLVLSTIKQINVHYNTISLEQYCLNCDLHPRKCRIKATSVMEIKFVLLPLRGPTV